MFNENLLHFIWQQKLIDADKLETTDGEKITIKKIGIHNQNAGPDFLQTQIIIGSALWAGSVEIHINSSDWLKHKHQDDQNYQNVVLHVVFNHDQELGLPTLELKGKIQRHLIERYQHLMGNQDWIPCEKTIHTVDPFVVNNLKNRLIIERLERKIISIKNDLDKTQNNWSETFYRNLLRYFGLKINADGFERVAENIPLKLVQKHADSVFQLEALLFGVAGLLNKVEDNYQKTLQTEYLFLKEKYGLKELNPIIWKFATLRPANFPTIRLAQFAALAANKPFNLEDVLYYQDPKVLYQKLNVCASTYWNKHYVFGKESEQTKVKKLGHSTCKAIIINHFVPIIYVYGWYHDKTALKEKALELLEKLTTEENQIIKKWRALGITSKTAFDSQALLELKLNYCAVKKCLNCSVGIALLRKNL